MPKYITFCKLKFAYLLGLCLWTHGILAQGQDLNALLLQLNQTKTATDKISLLNQIALLYQQQNAPRKAAEYYLQVYDIQKNTSNDDALSLTLQNLGKAYVMAGEYRAAILFYNDLLKIKQKKEDKKGQAEVISQLANLHKTTQEYEKAIEYSLDILQISAQTNDAIAIAEANNNLGFLYRQIGDQKLSLMYFERSISMYSILTEGATNNIEKVIALTNTGVTYSKIRDYTKANYYYSQALDLAKSNNLLVQSANIYNHIAANYFVSGNENNALQTVNQAIDIAVENKADEVLMVSYQLLSEIYQKQEDFKLSQRYDKLFQEIKEKIAQKERQKVQEALETQVEVERKENELKNLITDKERQSAALRQSALEIEKQEKDLALKATELTILKREQDLQLEQIKNQQLEKNRVQQLLLITQQQAQAEKQKQALAILEQNKKLQEVQAREKQNEIELLETDKKLQNQQLKSKQEQLEKANLIRNYGLAVLGLGTAVFLLILIGFFQNRKKNKLLKGQNQEIQQQSAAIQVQNEELYQQQEEILSQRGYIEEKNKELNTQNYKMSKSIEAALVIQQSLLPTENMFKQSFKEHFVIFYPKDIVSGDCYMLEKIDNKLFLIVVDCTGHGVAGAFMSLVANNILEKILYANSIHSPAEILAHLDQDVQIALKKEETGNMYGMDCAVVCLEYLNENQAQLSYAGAKRNLYYKPHHISQLQEIPADRRAIGNRNLTNQKVVFTNHQLIVERGTLIYLSSDGFADQCNINRRNWGSANFKKMLDENLASPLNKQKNVFEETFANYKQGADQRDDVTLIGVRV